MTSDQTHSGGTPLERERGGGAAAAPIDTGGNGRAVRDTPVRTVSQVLNAPTDRVRWGPIWAGLLTVLTMLLLLSLLGIAIGLTAVDAGAAAQGGGDPDAGRTSAIWAGIAALLAFLAGGYVAGRTAAVHERGWGALNGALVFLLALPIVIWLAGQGLGTIIGNASSIAQGLHINLGQLQSAVAGAARTITPAQAQQAADVAKTTAWGTLIGLLVALGASTLGGALGTRTRRTTPTTGVVAD